MHNRFVSILQHRSFQIFLILTIYVSIAHKIPLNTQRGFYAASLFIKELLIWFIPITVTVYITNAIQSFERKAPLFVMLLIIFEVFSNFISVWYAYLAANLMMKDIIAFDVVSTSNEFTPLWKLTLSKPLWWTPSKGVIIGLVLGHIIAYKKSYFLIKFMRQSNLIVEWILTKVFARLIPVFILGFAMQMYQMQILDKMFVNYAILIFWLLLYLSIYIFILFFIAAKGSLTKTLNYIKNLLPAAGIALSSGCSLSTMPWTIKCAAKNLKNPHLAKAIIPATTNIQQIGDAIANAFLSFLIYQNFYLQTPDLWMWLQFSFIFVIARFATAAIMGGAIFIMIPVYENYLNFNAEMVAVILALNIILDPVITTANVIANGALCKVFENLWNKTQNIVDYFYIKKVKVLDDITDNVP